MKQLLITALVTVLSGVCQSANGCDPFYPTYARREVVKVVEVVTPVVSTVLAFPVAVAVPAYGTAFVPQVAASTPPQQAPAWATEMLQRMDRLERRGGAPSRPMPGADPQETSSLSADSVFTNRCARCHEAAVAASKGGSFVLLRADGGEVELSASQVADVMARVASGEMPKGGPKMPSAELKVVRDWGKKVLTAAPSTAVLRRTKHIILMGRQGWEWQATAE